MGRRVGIVALLFVFGSGCAKQPLVLYLGSPPTETYTTTAPARPGYFEVQVSARCAENARQVSRFLVDPTGEYFIHGYEEKRGSRTLQIDRIGFTAYPAQKTTEIPVSALPAPAIALLVIVALPVALVMLTYNALHPWLDRSDIDGCWVWMEGTDGFNYQGTPPFVGVSDR